MMDATDSVATAMPETGKLPMPASAADYSATNDLDVLLHRAFELRRRARLYANENVLLTAEIAKRMKAGQVLKTQRYRAFKSENHVKPFCVRGSFRVQIKIEPINENGGE